MARQIAAFLFGVAVVAPEVSNAQIYSCERSDGRKVFQQTPCLAGHRERFVRCVRNDGSSYVRQGATCPPRTEPVPPSPGMVTDVRTGEQVYMVPGGGNGMIDPRTGARHELVSPPPVRTTQDGAERMSHVDACRDAEAQLDAVNGRLNRTIDQIRAAEDRVRTFCAGR